MLLAGKSAAQTVREDDFESYATGLADGTLPSSKGGFFMQEGRWTGGAGKGSGNTLEIAETTGRDQRATKAFVFRKVAGEVKAVGSLQPSGSQPDYVASQGVLSYEADVRMGDEKAAPFSYLIFGRFIRLESDSELMISDKSGATNLVRLEKAFPIGEWFRFRADLDYGTQTMTVFINGEKKSSQNLGEGGLSAVVNPRWDMSGLGPDEAVVYLDNVRMILHEPGKLPPTTVEAPVAKTGVSVTKPIPEEARLSLDFEKEGVWSSVPPDLLAQMLASGNVEADLWSFKEQRFHDLAVVPAVRWMDLAKGLVRSSEHVTSGKSSGRGFNHVRFPSLICRTPEMDWSNQTALSVSIYSEANTREVITVGLLSDNPETPWKDWYFCPFRLDFQGARKVVLPFTSFVKDGKPLGMNQITAVGLFCKAFGHQPSPLSDVTLDEIKAENPKDPVETNPVEPPTPTGDASLPAYRQTFYENLRILNHGEPELAVKNPVTTRTKVFSQESYFMYERAVAGYNPRFQPGYVSFDPKGKAYILAGDTIQWVESGGKWVSISIRKTLQGFGKSRGWKGIQNTSGSAVPEPMIRFDREGDAYLIAQVSELDADGNEVSWRQRTALLLHSHDGMRNWTVYVIPGGRWAAFEKLDGHNEDCLNRPPIIINADVSHFPGTDPGANLIVPEKKTDGTLSLQGPFKFGDYSTVGGYHSGDGNQVVTIGDKVYIVYNWVPMSLHFPEVRDSLAGGAVSAGLWGGVNWDVPHLKGTAVAATLPVIPEKHPANEMSHQEKGTGRRLSAVTGVPTFIRTFDLITRTFSEPVFLGYGGFTLDGHNTPSLSVDSKGILHVIINGHHDPVTYTQSLRPEDISAWSEPVYVGNGSAALSYATLTIDSKDMVHTVHRSSSDGLYNNRLASYRKRPGKDWEEERPIVYPFRYMYNVWYQRMTYDRKGERLFLTYNSRGGQMQLSQDMYEFYIFQFPDQEKRMAANTGDPKKDNPGRITPLPKPLLSTGGSMYQMTAGELTILVSPDHGETWRLAVTEDFR